MKDTEIGALIEAFINSVSHPPGRVLIFMAKASIRCLR